LRAAGVAADGSAVGLAAAVVATDFAATVATASGATFVSASVPPGAAFAAARAAAAGAALRGARIALAMPPRLMLVPDEKVMRLKMSVADGLKYIISLGAIAPEFRSPIR